MLQDICVNVFDRSRDFMPDNGELRFEGEHTQDEDLVEGD